MRLSYLVYAVAITVFLLGHSVSAAQIGLWHMEDCGTNTLTDSSGQGNNGVSNQTTSVVGVLGNGCGYFTNAANNSRTTVATNALLKNATAAVTINMWVKRSSQSNILPVMMDYASVAQSRGLLMSLNPLTPSIDLMNASGAAVRCSLSASTAYNLSLDTWTMLTYVYDKPTVTIYVNGVSAASKDCVINDIVYGNAPIIFADYGTASIDKFNGSMDDVGIWNSSLSAAEIYAQYQYGTANHQTCQTFYDYCANITLPYTDMESNLWLWFNDGNLQTLKTEDGSNYIVEGTFDKTYFRVQNSSEHGWTLPHRIALGTDSWSLYMEVNSTSNSTSPDTYLTICLNSSNIGAVPVRAAGGLTDNVVTVSLSDFTQYYRRNFTFLEQTTGILYDFTNKDAELTATCDDYSTVTVNLSTSATNSNIILQTLQRPRIAVVTNNQPARIRDDAAYQLRDNYILTDANTAQQFYFRLNDYTGGQFYQSTIAFKTAIPGYGPQNIHVEQFSDDNIVYPLLTNQTPYSIVLSTDTRTRDLGSVFLRGDETVKEVIVTRPDFTMTKSSWENNNITIIWNYNTNQITCAWDLLTTPTLINYTVYNVSGTTRTKTYGATAATAAGTLAYTVQNNNGTYFVHCESLDATYGTRFIEDTINFRNTSAILGRFDMNLPATVAGLGRSTLYKLLAVVVICLFAGMFGMRDIGLGGIVTSLLMLLFNWVGWLTIPWWMVAFLFTIAVFFKLMEGRTGVVN